MSQTDIKLHCLKMIIIPIELDIYGANRRCKNAYLQLDPLGDDKKLQRRARSYINGVKIRSTKGNGWDVCRIREGEENPPE